MFLISVFRPFRVPLRSSFRRFLDSQWTSSLPFSVTVTPHPSEQLSLSKAKSFREIPGPRLLENLTRYARGGFSDYHVFLEKMFKRHGPIFKFVMPGVKVVHVCDPDDIQRVYRAEGYPSCRGDVIAASLYYREKGLPTGFLSDDECSWRIQRSAAAPKLLRPGELAPFVSELCNVADDAIATFKDGRNLDVSKQLKKAATESVGVFLFGLRVGLFGPSPDPKAQEFIDAISGRFSIESKMLYSIPFHKYFKTPTVNELYRCLDKEWEVSDHFVEKARQLRSPLSSKSLVYRLAKEEKMSRETILQISEGAFSGGVHTTSGTLLILLHVLSKRPEVQQKLHDQIQSVLPNKQQPTYEQFRRMPYVKTFMKEVFRTQPTPVGNVRLLRQPIVLSGYIVPPRNRLILSAVATEAMQEKSYGPDYATFSPERWFHDSKEKHPFASASLPFGFGPRTCLGKRVVEMEMSLFLIRLLQKFEIVDSNRREDQVEWYFNMIHTPTQPYNLNLKRRK